MLDGQQRRKIRRSIFVGLGGTGYEVIRLLKRDMLLHGFDLELFQYTVLDTVAFDERTGMGLNGKEYLYIGNYDPNKVLNSLDNWPVIGSWWGNRARTDLVTVDEGAGQMRSVGRMGFFYHFNMIKSQLQRMVQTITDVSNREAASKQGYEVSNNGPIVYLVFSLCGGTGSGLFFDVAYVLRELLNYTDSPPTFVGLAMLPGPYMGSISSIPQRERIQANAFAALAELERLHNMALDLEDKPNGKDLWNVQYASDFHVDSANLPFEYFYLIDNVTSAGEVIRNRDLIYEKMSKAIFWLSGPSTEDVFWQRAKNLFSKTAAAGTPADSSGTKRLSFYSSLGVSTVTFDWSIENIQRELENRFIERIRLLPPSKVSLPPYFNTDVALTEELSGEQSRVNPFPPNKQLRAVGTFRDRAAIDEMRDQLREKYDARLSRLLTSPNWIRSKEQCYKTVQDTIDTQLQEALRTRGPAATRYELEQLRERLNDLRTAVIEKKQEQQSLKSEREADMTKAYAADHEGMLGQMLYRLRSLPADIYLFKQFRRNSSSRSRELIATATNAAKQCYSWYDASFKTLIYNDIVDSILTPLIAYIDEQKKPLDGIEDSLEVWYNRNKDDDQMAYKRRNQEQDNIRPSLSENDRIQSAIVSGGFNLDYAVQQVLRRTFKRWPLPIDEITDLFQSHLSGEALEALKYIGGEEHLAERLISPEMSHERHKFLRGADCLWNFIRENNQETIPGMESINLLGYGIDPRQEKTTREIEATIEELFHNESSCPEFVTTEVSDEIVLLKTQHGLMISALRSIRDMQHAYQVMNIVRRAPYLHIDYSYQVRVAYKPLANLEITPLQIVTMWRDMAGKLEGKKSDLADNIREIAKHYEAQYGSTPREMIDIKCEEDPFFDFVDQIWKRIIEANQTPSVTQALMMIADMEEILLAQGWLIIDPTFNDLWNPDLHEVVRREKKTDMKPNRVIETEKPGYIRRRKKQLPQVRKARVVLSTQ